MVDSTAMDGRVRCPLNGDIDVEWCVDCPYVESAEQCDGELIIHCHPRRSVLSDADLLGGLRV
jgi:hypothetical protein